MKYNLKQQKNHRKKSLSVIESRMKPGHIVAADFSSGLEKQSNVHSSPLGGFLVILLLTLHINLLAQDSDCTEVEKVNFASNPDHMQQ